MEGPIIGRVPKALVHIEYTPLPKLGLKAFHLQALTRVLCLWGWGHYVAFMCNYQLFLDQLRIFRNYVTIPNSVLTDHVFVDRSGVP